MNGRTSAVLFLWALSALAAFAAPVSGGENADKLLAQVERQLAIRYPQARVEITGSVKWLRGEMPTQWSAISLQGETPRAEAQFEVQSPSGNSLGQVSFAAWVPARLAMRRVLPNEKLSSDQFAVQQVNIAQGQAGELKNALLSTQIEVEGLEAKQTIMEGSLLTNYSVQRTPDVKRGDSLQIKIQSGDLIVTTQGTALEAGYKNSKVRVLSSKTKREMNGMLSADGSVEVKL